jgi:VIT1/CCC1 family predicted Fe2+/Mn2+ transporter
MSGASGSDAGEVARHLQNYRTERDGAALYHALAKADPDRSRAAVFEKLAEAEERHAERWAKLLRAAGAAVPEHRASGQVRLLAWLARRFGAERVLPIVSGLEARDQDAYSGQADAAGLPAEERGHRRALAMLETGPRGAAAVLAREGWHRRSGSGSLRAAVFGVSDGLVSNLGLVMGLAGAQAEPRMVLVSGVAGLLAGAFAMASGEWLSMRTQREVFERQLALEKEELEASPEEEAEELSLIYQAKGIPEGEAQALSRRMLGDPKVALDTLAREELGLDPSELGSPWGAAVASLLAFAVGAAVPLLPFLLGVGRGAVAGSAGLSALALFGVGALLSAFTARGPLLSGARMLGVGVLSAAATYGIGHLLGVSLAG